MGIVIDNRNIEFPLQDVYLLLTWKALKHISTIFTWFIPQYYWNNSGMSGYKTLCENNKTKLLCQDHEMIIKQIASSAPASLCVWRVWGLNYYHHLISAKRNKDMFHYYAECFTWKMRNVLVSVIHTPICKNCVSFCCIPFELNPFLLPQSPTDSPADSGRLKLFQLASPAVPRRV